MSSRVIGSILHGAYGDHYEQAVCLKDFSLRNPDKRLKLFAAAPNRLAELRALDFSWADCFALYTEIPNHSIDEFFQFQSHDRELRSGVLSQLPDDIARKLDQGPNRLPWDYLRSILPLAPKQQLGLSEFGRNLLPTVMRENEIDPNIFERPTIGFQWRYRGPGGAVNPLLQPAAKELVAKYSRLFRRLIDEYHCHILICGMKVARTPENMYRIDAKYPEYGLDLPAESATHLKGLSWALELEILSRCTLCVANPSGFSEALWIKRGAGVILVDPPAHYLAKALRHRAPLFDLQKPLALASAFGSRWFDVAFKTIRTQLERSLLESSPAVVANLQNIAP